MRNFVDTITILKTPYGYLTTQGFTDNINSGDLVVVWNSSLKKCITKKGRLRYFLNLCYISQKIKEVLEQECLFECKFFTYSCTYSSTYSNSCYPCRNSKYCSFWNDDRTKLKFTELK